VTARTLCMRSVTGAPGPLPATGPAFTTAAARHFPPSSPVDTALLRCTSGRPRLLFLGAGNRVHRATFDGSDLIGIGDDIPTRRGTRGERAPPRTGQLRRVPWGLADRLLEEDRERRIASLRRPGIRSAPGRWAARGGTRGIAGPPHRTIGGRRARRVLVLTLRNARAARWCSSRADRARVDSASEPVPAVRVRVAGDLVTGLAELEHDRLRRDLGRPCYSPDGSPPRPRTPRARSPRWQLSTRASETCPGVTSPVVARAERSPRPGRRSGRGPLDQAPVDRPVPAV